MPQSEQPADPPQPERTGPQAGAERDGRAVRFRPEETSRVRLYFLIGLALAGLYLVGVMLWPFLPAILTSVVVSALAWPAYRPLRDRVGRRDVAAVLGTVILFFVILLPLVGLSVVLLNQARTGIDWVAASAGDLLRPEGRVSQWIDVVAEHLGAEPAGLAAALQDQARDLAGTLAARTVGLFTGIGGWFLQAGTALFTVYYLLRDGDRLLERLKQTLPIEPEQTDRLIARAAEINFATIYGNLAVAVAQGALGGLAFWALGLPAPAVWGLVMGILSLLPVIGPFLVWAPAVVILFATGAWAKALALLAFGALVVSSVDNVLRAILVGGRAELHPLVVFFSVLGGLVVFGAVGMFVGPVLFVMALTLIEMARLTLEPEAAAGPGLGTSGGREGGA
jgi:predicted PurR-regulated permease PerM